ncbi:GTPase-associated system all-helical protein GASH [Hyphomonas sp. UBA3195]|jgi:hypothetical protein|uniref:GTPase-associated system all-helical protein GASH n=4 Tax=Hyphomonas TaxID=85 RepID=UPI0025BA49FF|nr:GTPase-associated system all-helical protein GASH [Hyphomonas sp. UBA3195]
MRGAIDRERKQRNYNERVRYRRAIQKCKIIMTQGAFVADRILETFLDAGLLELGGNDAWFEHISAAADKLAVHIGAHPEQLAAFVYSAVDPRERLGDPSRAMAQETLKSVWRTYSSVTMGSLDLVFRGIILDAVIQNAKRDDQIRLGVTLLLSSALPHMSLGEEAEVWQKTVSELLSAVEAEAEARWSVPSAIALAPMVAVKPPEIKGKLGAIKIDEAALLKGLEKAAGPNNKAGEETGGNPHAPNAGATWSNEFVPLATEAIATAVKRAAGERVYNLASDEIFGAISTMVTAYVSAAINQTAAASHGVELRSRLLWWKEAKISPSARKEYRLIDRKVAPGLMALDYQSMLPALAPASVVAFLRESVRTLSGENETTSLGDFLAAMSEADEIVPFKSSQPDQTANLRPLGALVLEGATRPELISERTVFQGTLKLDPAAFASLLFLEFQALKAIQHVTPVSPPDEAGTAGKVTGAAK